MDSTTTEVHLGNLVLWKTTPREGAWARLLLIHGLGEHSGRHLNTEAALVQSGIEVVRFDLRGAGKSGGRRQWVERFTDYVEDVAQVQNWISRNREPLPLFVLGHSLGGAVAIYFAEQYQELLSGLVLSAPAYLVGQGVSPLKIAIGRVLNRLAPNLRIPSALEPNTLSRDPEVEAEYKRDPLSSHFNTVQQGNQILQALEALPDSFRRLQLPLLLVHGTHDRIIRLEGSYLIMEAAPSKHKEMLILPAGLHEPHNDLDKAEYFTHLTRWCRKLAFAPKK